MEIKEEIGKVIAVRKKAICSNCGTEMLWRRKNELNENGFLVFSESKYEYACTNCGKTEESDKLYPLVDIVPVFDNDEEK